MANEIHLNLAIKGDDLFEEIITNEWMNGWEKTDSAKKKEKMFSTNSFCVQVDAFTNSPTCFTKKPASEWQLPGVFSKKLHTVFVTF